MRSSTTGTPIARSSSIITNSTKSSKIEQRGVFDAYQQELRSWAGQNHDDLVTHVHEWRRNELAEASPAADDVPFHADA